MTSRRSLLLAGVAALILPGDARAGVFPRVIAAASSSGVGAVPGALLYAQNWDASESLPSGWTFVGTTPTGSTAQAISSTNSFAFPTGNVGRTQLQWYNTPDTNSGNVMVSAKFWFQNTMSNSGARLMARGNPGANTYYGVIFNNSGALGVGGTSVGIQLIKLVNWRRHRLGLRCAEFWYISHDRLVPADAGMPRHIADGEAQT